MSAVRWASTRVLRKVSSLPPASEAAASARLGPLQRLAHPVLHDLEAGGYFLEEVVDILGVIAAHLLAELHLTQRLGRDVHGAMVVRVPGPIRDRCRHQRADRTLDAAHRADQKPRPARPE